MELIELNYDRHRHLKLRQMPSFLHVEGKQMAALAIAEIPKAAQAYPVLFARTDNGFHPFAIFGLDENENLFLDGTVWSANYLPASVRSYPFRLAGERVLIDEAAPHFEDESGVALFNENGVLSVALEEQLAFLRACYAAETETSFWLERLADFGLLAERDIEVVSPKGRRHKLQGFYVVDTGRISLLPDAALASLVRDGSFAIIHAHLLSLEHLTSLAVRRDHVAGCTVDDGAESRIGVFKGQGVNYQQMQIVGLAHHATKLDE